MLNTLDILRIPYEVVDVCTRSNLNYMLAVSKRQDTPQLFYCGSFLMGYTEFFELVENKEIVEELKRLIKEIDEEDRVGKNETIDEEDRVGENETIANDTEEEIEDKSISVQRYSGNA